MSYNTSLGLDYFINNLSFVTSPTGSLVVSSQTVARILPSNHFSQSQVLKHTAQTQEVFLRIAKALKTKLLLVELDFKQLRITDQHGIRVFKHKWEQLFTDPTFLELLKKNNFSVQACVQAFLAAPVMATDPKSNIFNFKLCQFLTNEPLQTVVVVSGEMIWSRWINTFMLSQLLTGWFPRQDRSVVLDHNGVWQLLIYTSQSKLMELDQSYLEPNFFYFGEQRMSKHTRQIELEAYADNDLAKALIVTPDRAAIFHLDHEYLYGGIIVRGDIYFATSKQAVPITPRGYSSWWPQLQFQLEALPEYRLQPELSLQTQQIEFELEASELSVASGQSVTPGEILGSVIPTSRRYQKISGKTKNEPKMAMLEGQFVKAGEPLYYLQGKLLTTMVKAEHSGQVGYEFIRHGLIAISGDQQAAEFKSIFTGKIIAASKKKARIGAVGLCIPAFRLVGRPCYGQLCIDMSTSSLYPRIVAMPWAQFITFSELELIQSEVSSFILTGVDQLAELLSRLNLLIVDALSEPSAKLLDILDKFGGCLCVLDASSLKLVINSQEQKKYLDLVAPPMQPSPSGELFCEISYEQPMRYVRMNNSSQKLTLANVIFYG